MVTHDKPGTTRRLSTLLVVFALVVAALQGAGVATSSSASAATTGEVAANYARASLVGKTYVYGGRTTSGFDCSGSVYLAWAKAKSGVVGKGSSSSQYGGKGTKVKIGRGTTLTSASLKPGDLMFWSTDGTQSKIYHVAIYLGKGQILQTAKGKKSWIGGINDNKSQRMAYALRPAS